MLWLYAACIVVLLVVNLATLAAFTRILRSRDRAHARERDLLVNQLCNLAGRPWQEPPAWSSPTVPDVVPDTWDEPVLTSSPEQRP